MTDTPGDSRLFTFEIVWRHEDVPGDDEHIREVTTRYIDCTELKFHDNEISFIDRLGRQHYIQKSNFLDLVIEPNT